MSDSPQTPSKNPRNADKPSQADRIAKVMARAGVASRREAERMILEGRVTVNFRLIDSPALDVLPSDVITVDGKQLDEKQETRLWLYYKPTGLVTTESDEKGRQTIFDALPRDLPRVMTVGRLDLNSEGLLLLTNDGELKRRLELPSTGWLRRYRVRVNGTPNDLTFAPLRRGVTIDGEDFAPMEIRLDSQQGANAWLTVGIREGRNREIRRAMAHIGLQVNRLIRVGYGPFKLTGLEKNEVVEVKRKVLRDQLGGLLTGEAEDKPREIRPRGAEGPRAPRPFGRDRGEGDAAERPQRRFAAAAPRRRDERDGQLRRDGKPHDKPGRPGGARIEGEDRPPRRFGAKPFGRSGDEAGRKGGFGGPRGERPDDKGAKPRKPRFGGGSDGPGKPGGFRARPESTDGGATYAGRSGGKPGEKPLGDRFRGGKADGRPDGKPGGKPGGKPAARFGAKFGAKPGGKPDGKPGGRTGGKPGGPAGRGKPGGGGRGPGA